jgi:hypothetical protein
MERIERGGERESKPREREKKQHLIFLFSCVMLGRPSVRSYVQEKAPREWKAYVQGKAPSEWEVCVGEGVCSLHVPIHLRGWGGVGPS